LLRELRLLERVVHRGGRDSVDHPRNGHDDFANSCCGCLRLLSTGSFDLGAMLRDVDDSDSAMTESERNAAWRQSMFNAYIMNGGRRW
jgi:hypothetical protein